MAKEGAYSITSAAEKANRGESFGNKPSSYSGSSGSSGDIRVYDTKKGQYITVSQKIYDSMKSQGSMRYSESSGSSTYIGSSQRVATPQPSVVSTPDRITSLQLQLANAPPGTDITQLQEDIRKERHKLEMKRAALESPTAQWASVEAYQQAYASLGNYAEKVRPPKEIIIASTPASRRREAERQFAEWKSSEGIEPSTARMTQNEYGEIVGFEGIKKSDLFPEFSGPVKSFPEAV